MHYGAAPSVAASANPNHQGGKLFVAFSVLATAGACVALSLRQTGSQLAATGKKNFISEWFSSSMPQVPSSAAKFVWTLPPAADNVSHLHSILVQARDAFSPDICHVSSVQWSAAVQLRKGDGPAHRFNMPLEAFLSETATGQLDQAGSLSAIASRLGSEQVDVSLCRNDCCMPGGTQARDSPYPCANSAVLHNHCTSHVCRRKRDPSTPSLQGPAPRRQEPCCQELPRPQLPRRRSAALRRTLRTSCSAGPGLHRRATPRKTGQARPAPSRQVINFRD